MPAHLRHLEANVDAGIIVYPFYREILVLPHFWWSESLAKRELMGTPPHLGFLWPVWLGRTMFFSSESIEVTSNYAEPPHLDGKLLKTPTLGFKPLKRMARKERV